jgi:hypothetical protein
VMAGASSRRPGSDAVELVIGVVPSQEG